jgi:pimeloyl-ACP methyl ester carboxylesterase
MPPADRSVVDDPAFRAYLEGAADRTSPTTARAVAQDLALLAGDWDVALDDIAVGVTIWHGADDRLVEPWQADVLAKSIPGADLVVVEGEGHLLFVRRVGEILRELAAATA